MKTDLLDILYSVDFLDVLELLDDKVIFSFGLISKSFRQSALRRIKWARLLERRMHSLSSLPLRRIANSYYQYVESTQTIFVTNLRPPSSGVHYPIAIHPSATVLDLLNCHFQSPTEIQFPTSIILYHNKVIVETIQLWNHRALITHLEQMQCLSIFHPGSALRMPGGDYVFFGKGSFEWSSSPWSRVEQVTEPYIPNLQLRFNSDFIAMAMNAWNRYEIKADYPSIIHYLMSGRRWILSKHAHIYFPTNISPASEGIQLYYERPNFHGTVYLELIAEQFENILKAEYNGEFVDDPLDIPGGTILWTFAAQIGLPYCLPVFDAMSRDWVVIGWDRSGFSLSLGTVAVSSPLPTLKDVLECLAALAFKNFDIRYSFDTEDEVIEHEYYLGGLPVIFD